MQKRFCVCEKLKIDTYWKITQTFHTKPALNPSLCTTGDGGQIFKHSASPEKFFYWRQEQHCRVSDWTTKTPPLFTDSASASNAASLSPSAHYKRCKITVSTPSVVHYVAKEAPFEIQLLTMKLQTFPTPHFCDFLSVSSPSRAFCPQATKSNSVSWECTI